MAYKVVYPEAKEGRPEIIPDLSGGTTSWRQAKKALRQWYIDEAKALRSISEKDYFNDSVN